MSNFLMNLALRGAGIPAAVQLEPSRSAMLASEPGMFPAADIPVTNATASPSGAVNPSTTSTPAGIVQREPAAVMPLAPAAPPAPLTPSQPTSTLEAVPSSPQSFSPLESSQTTPTASRGGEVRPPIETAYRDTTVRPAERAQPVPAEVEARDGEATTPVLPRVVEPPKPAAANPASIVSPPPASSAEAMTPYASLKPAHVAQGQPITGPGPVEIGHAQPRPATPPEPVAPAKQPPFVPPVDAVQPAARPVEVRIGRIEVRVNSPAPAPPPAVPPAEALAARPAEGAGFDEYDGIRGYRFPTGW